MAVAKFAAAREKPPSLCAAYLYISQMCILIDNRPFLLSVIRPRARPLPLITYKNCYFTVRQVLIFSSALVKVDERSSGHQSKSALLNALYGEPRGNSMVLLCVF